MVNYIPEFQGYSGQGAFRYWCQKVLPLVYDDSLSYYELLNKIVVYLNNTIEDVAKAEGNIDSLLTAYTQLQGYVNDYFDNLDVQEEINNKLDAMAESGELSDLISPFIPDLVTAWLNEHITPTTPIVDNTLSITGAAADAKATGNELAKTIRTTGLLLTPTDTEDYTTANDFPLNTIIGIEGTITEDIIANLPEYGIASYVITSSLSPTAARRFQLFINRHNISVRAKTSSGSWSLWMTAADEFYTPMYRPFDKNNYNSLAEVPENTAYVFSDVSWSDLPDGVLAGVYFSFRYSPSFKVQIIFCLNTGNFGVWWRVVDRTTYAVELNWQKITSENDMAIALRSSQKYIQHSNLQGYTSANDFEANYMYEIASDVVATDIANLPEYGELAYIFTPTYNPATAYSMQIYINQYKMYTRIKRVGGWDNWTGNINYHAITPSNYNSVAELPYNFFGTITFSNTSWSDYPEGVVAGAFFSYKYAPNYKLQFIVQISQSAHNINRIWFRTVNANTYEVYSDWMQMPNIDDVNNIIETTVIPNTIKYISSLRSYLTEINKTKLGDIKENAIVLYNKVVDRVHPENNFSVPDSAFDSMILLNMRYSPNFNIQFAFTTNCKQFKYRIVDRRDGTEYTTWNAPDSFDGKVCLAMGDSICVGSRNSRYGFIGYFGLDLTKLSYVGACISNIRVTENTDTENLCIYKQFENYANNLEHFDYYPDILIADGGINDYVYHSPLGTEPTSPVTTDSEANNLDKGTISGGLQYLFYLWIKNYPKAQKYFLLTHKTYFTSSSTYAPVYVGTEGYNQTQMNDMIKKICNVYGVEVIDVFGKSMINTKLKQYVSPVAYNLETNTDADQERITNSYFVDSDGIHPLALGYREGYVPFVREALKTSTKKELLDDYMYYEYDGSNDENWLMGTVGDTPGRRFVIRDDSFPYYVDYGITAAGTPNEQLNLIKSNQYPEGTHDTPPSSGYETITLRQTPSNRGFQLYNSNFTNLEDFKTYLSTNPLKVIIKKPVFTTE